jgi:hypothetical protein
VTDAVPTSEQIKESLINLGETDDDIAKALLERGVRGVRGMARCCPIANYLTKEFPGIKGIGVTPVYVRVDDGVGEVYAFLPESAEAFVKRFDRGDYKGLMIAIEELAQVS